jgi:hypothetical protein
VVVLASLGPQLLSLLVEELGLLEQEPARLGSRLRLGHPDTVASGVSEGRRPPGQAIGGTSGSLLRHAVLAIRVAATAPSVAGPDRTATRRETRVAVQA